MDLADKYPPAEVFEDDCPTVKVNMQAVHPLVFVDDEPTLPSARVPVILPPKEKTYPGVGLLIAFGTGFLFWGAVAWLVWGYYHANHVSTPEAGVEVVQP